MEKMNAEDSELTKKFNPEEGSQSTFTKSCTSSVDDSISSLLSLKTRKKRNVLAIKITSTDLERNMPIFGNLTLNGKKNRE
jgi:hypothetical protein